MKRGALTPYLFLLPAMIFFTIWVVSPIVQSFATSFYQWNGLTPATFVGFDNYVRLFNSHQFWISLRNNVYWLVCFMLAPPLGLFVALFLNQELFGMRLAKSLFFFPFVLAPVVIGLTFSWFYQPAGGLLNTVLTALGLPDTSLLTNQSIVTFAIIVAGLWPMIAYCMIIYLVGLNGVDPEQIEAARIEGARGVRLLWHVILPQLRAATFIAVVITVIGALRSFDLIAVMTGGGPVNSSSVLAWYSYEAAIGSYNLGYGAAIAVVLFLIMSVFIAFFLWRILKGVTR